MYININETFQKRPEILVSLQLQVILHRVENDSVWHELGFGFGFGFFSQIHEPLHPTSVKKGIETHNQKKIPSQSFHSKFQVKIPFNFLTHPHYSKCQGFQFSIQFIQIPNWMFESHARGLTPTPTPTHTHTRIPNKYKCRHIMRTHHLAPTQTREEKKRS
jgi:hypothetical protein